LALKEAQQFVISQPWAGCAKASPVQPLLVAATAPDGFAHVDAVEMVGAVWPTQKRWPQAMTWHGFHW